MMRAFALPRSVAVALAFSASTTLVRADVAPESAPAATVAAQAAAATPLALTLPNADGALKFAVLGDFGTGDKPQYALAETMAKVHERFAYELVVLVGDNIYGSDRPQDYKKKFELPYKPLLDAGVLFHGSLGNHDAREQRFYKLFNMDGKLYYSFKAPKQDVRFIALESTYMEPAQVKWLEETLSSARESWKIVFFHHPLYSSGMTHGSDERLRSVLEPLFVKYGVSLVLSGHDHFYERIKPQKAITYFVAGSGGKLREGDVLRNQPFSAKIVDDTNVFLAVEIKDDALVFNAVATNGTVVDAGRVERVKKPESSAATAVTREGVGQ
jgi:predicted MPP superfamily phosphohydrolase